MDQSIDYGEAGITNVRSEWGMNDGRGRRAMDFYQMFVTERGANGNDSAVSLTTAAIRDECGFVKVDLDQFRTASAKPVGTPGSVATPVIRARSLARSVGTPAQRSPGSSSP